MPGSSVSSRVLLATPPAATDRYTLHLTTDPDDVTAAQRLRHRVFAGELGARIPDPDVDRFDPHCDHLVVREEATGALVGTYRMLPPGRTPDLYAGDEFTVDVLAPLRPTLVETGRSCVHPEHRSGAVVGLMWAGLARYLTLTGNRWLLGCASVPLRDGGGLAAQVWRQVSRRHLAPEPYRMAPRVPWPLGEPRTAPLPPLLRGYLRLGAWVCGPPAYDARFACADFPVLFDMDRLDERYLRFFLGSG